jgi:hypothetical protein
MGNDEELRHGSVLVLPLRVNSRKREEIIVASVNRYPLMRWGKSAYETSY